MKSANYLLAPSVHGRILAESSALNLIHLKPHDKCSHQIRAYICTEIVYDFYVGKTWALLLSPQNETAKYLEKY